MVGYCQTIHGIKFYKLPVYQNFRTTYRTLLLTIIGCCYGLLVAGQSYPDSLKLVLNISSGDQRFEILKDLFAHYVQNDFETANQYAEKAYLQAVDMGDSLLMVRAGRMRGYALEKIGRVDESIDIYTNVLGIAQRNKYDELVKFLLNNLGLSYLNRGNYDKSLEYHFQSLVVREAQGDQTEVSITLNNIGLVYYTLKNYEVALDYYQRSKEIKERIKDDYGLDHLLINIGLCYNKLQRFQDAIDIINKAFKLCGDECDESILKEGYFGLGEGYFEIRKIDLAVSAFEKSLSIARKQNDKLIIIENLNNLARINIERKEWDTAIRNLNEANTLAAKTEYVSTLIDIYKLYSSVYDSLSDYKQSSFYRGEYIVLKDSVYSAELIKNLAKVQTNYEERENKAIIASRDEVIERQKRLNFAVAVIAVLATLLLFVLYRSNIVKKRVNNALSDAKATIEAQNRELSKLNKGLEETVDIRTEELQISNTSLQRVNFELDNFIYKTSHDIRGPLASLRGMCNVAIMDVKDETAIDYLKKLEVTAERLNTILSRLLFVNQINHSKPSSNPIDFGALINDIILLEKKKGMPPRFKIISEIQERITFFSDNELIRIILENLIDNAIKFHNDSARVDPFVKICITKKDLKIDIRVIDNGIGIDEKDSEKVFRIFSRASERSETGGIGLYLTRTATEKLGGSVTIGTTKEGFTEFSVKFNP